MSLSFALLRLPQFRFYLSTRVCSIMALQAQAVIVGWQIYSITKDPLMLGLVGLAEALPAICAALFSGHVVDNHNPLHIFRWSLGLLSLNILLLFLAGGGLLPLAQGHLVPFLFAGVFASGLIRSFIMPASFSILPRIIERKDIPAASAWGSTGFQMAAVTGPAMAGLIYGGYGPLIAWLMPTALMAIAFVLSLRMHVEHVAKLVELRERMWDSIRDGWRFIFSKPVLLNVMALDMFAVLFGSVVAILPAVADQILNTGSEGLGLLRAAPAVGSGLVAILLAVRPMQIISARRLLLVIAGFGLCMIGFGLSQIFALSLLFLALSGGFDAVSMVIRQTMMQWETPEHMRGRVSSVNSMFVISSNEIGAFRAGVGAHFIELVPSILAGGVGTLMVVAVSSMSRTFRRTIIRSDTQ